MLQSMGSQRVGHNGETEQQQQKEYVVYIYVWASLVAQMVKNLLVMQETQVQSPGWEDPLEEGMETHFSILAWRIPWTEEPGRLQSMGSQRVKHNGATNTFFTFSQ